MSVPSPFAKEWCRSQHDAAWASKTGDEFEEYVVRVLEVFHDDFVNPSPAGQLGDRKCDGLANAGKLFYACYGSRPQPGSTERAIVDKLSADFNGAISQWSAFEEWRFITNARTGPDVAAIVTKLQDVHGESAERKVRVRLWSRSTELWNRMISTMSQEQLDLVFPGRPGLVSPDLRDLEPLLDVLGSDVFVDDGLYTIKEVPADKMDFNGLSLGSQFEMQAGRVMAPRIDKWYLEQSDPDLYDQHGARFRSIYLGHLSNHPGRPTEIMEGMYQSLAGAGFRLNEVLANSVYTVTAYFFDRCHIFETPEEVGDSSVAAD